MSSDGANLEIRISSFLSNSQTPFEMRPNYARVRADNGQWQCVSLEVVVLGSKQANIRPLQ